MSASASDEPLDAGPFGTWLSELEDARAGRAAAEVPCAGCTACCTASQFVHVEPDEADALAHIPRELLFPAPRAPKGHVLLGYDEQGRCPMLVDDRCSIYAHRPRACRTYDCRVFAAAGLDADADGDRTKAAIAARARRWRFRHEGTDDRPDEGAEEGPSDGTGDGAEHAAVRAAAAWVRAHRSELPDDVRPATPAQVALAAIDARSCFAGGEAATVTPADVVVRLRRHGGSSHHGG